MHYVATDDDIKHYRSCGLSLIEWPPEYDGAKHWHVFKLGEEEKGFNAANSTTAWAIAAISFGISAEI